MKQFIFIILSIVLIAGCQQTDEPEIRQETGVVINYAGAEHCGIVIELDNGQRIQPLRYPEGFVFSQGQRLLVNFTVLPNIVSACGKGLVSEILNVEELECGSPLVDILKEDYPGISTDPVNIQEISIDGECLYLRVSYSGGCRNHTFNLIRIVDSTNEDDTAVLELVHDANGDLCEAWLSVELRFSLAVLKNEGYKRFYFNALLENNDTFTRLFEVEE